MKTQTLDSNSRRGFLKKATYVAPLLVVLGTLTEASASAHGNNSNGQSASAPGQTGTAPGLAKKSTGSKIF